MGDSALWGGRGPCHWWHSSQCQMQGMQHNWWEALPTCSQVGYVDETWL